MADTLYTQALDANTGGWNNYTVVMRFAPAALTLPTAPILRIRFTFEAATTEGFQIGAAYVGHRAGAGDAYDFSTTPVQILFGGSGGVTISTSSTSTSDWATFAYDKTSDLLVAWYFNSTTDSPRAKTGLSNIYNYDNGAGGNSASTVNKSGFSVTNGRQLGINKIEVETESGGFFFFF